MANPSKDNEVPRLPLIVNTWPFTNATKAAWHAINLPGKSSLDAVEIGCTQCEIEQCDGTVGYGGSPDENGETTLDAMIMDGQTMNVGAVGCLRRIKAAVSVARYVLERTKHTLLVGELATEFAKSMGFQEESLSTKTSEKIFEQWKQNSCQPNFWQNVDPDPSKLCGPYVPKHLPQTKFFDRFNDHVNSHHHDTIGMIAIDSNGRIAAATSTNGASHKIPGRIGDSPIAGAGAYADERIGAAVGTGDGDVLMRFLPSLRTVLNMESGMKPEDAANQALKQVARFYPKFSGAIVAADRIGNHGAACYGFTSFKYSIYAAGFSDVQVEDVPCIRSEPVPDNVL